MTSQRVLVANALLLRRRIVAYLTKEGPQDAVQLSAAMKITPEALRCMARVLERDFNVHRKVVKSSRTGSLSIYSMDLDGELAAQKPSGLASINQPKQETVKKWATRIPKPHDVLAALFGLGVE